MKTPSTAGDVFQLAECLPSVLNAPGWFYSTTESQVWWYILLIPAFEEWGQEDNKFKVSLGHRVSSWATGDPVSKNTIKATITKPPVRLQASNISWTYIHFVFLSFYLYIYIYLQVCMYQIPWTGSCRWLWVTYCECWEPNQTKPNPLGPTPRSLSSLRWTSHHSPVLSTHSN